MIKSLIKRSISFEKNSHLKKIFYEKQKRNIVFDDIRRVLCVQMNAIGDTIMTQPAWSALKESLPNVKIDLMCQPHIALLFQNDPSIFSVFACQSQKTRPWRFKNFNYIKKKMGDERYDLIIDFTALPLTAALCADETAPPSIGFQRLVCTPWDQTDITKAYDLSNPYSDNDNLREVMLRLVSPWGINGGKKYSPKLPLPNESLERAQKLLNQKGLAGKPFIVLHPGAKWIPKRWPISYWIRLIKQILSQRNLAIILLGSSDDAESIECMAKSIDSSVIIPIICNDLNLSSSIIKRAKLCVCNDSAPMHIAAAVKTPSIAMFGPVSPRRSAPPIEEGCSILCDNSFCSPCTLYYSRNRCRRGLNFCMFAITPSLVNSLIEKKLYKFG